MSGPTAPCRGPVGPVDLGLLVLRTAPAVVFAVHGYVKLFGGQFDRTVALFMAVNIPAPEPMAWFVSILELGGGVLLGLGLATRLIAALLAVEMAVALTRVIWPRGFLGGAEFEFTLLVVCLALIATGSGKISLDGARTSRGVRSAGGSLWRIMR